jgi:hypothetical protein
MSVRRLTLLIVVWLIAAVAHAGHHKFGIYVAPSYLHADGSSLDLAGWHVSGEAGLGDHDDRWLSVVGDISAHFVQLKDETPDETTQVTLMVGPRFTVKPTHPLHDFYGHVLLLGVAHRTGDGEAEGKTAGSLAIGAGYDIELGGVDNWGVRAQVDFVLPVSSDLGNGWRYSVGVVYRFTLD